MSIQQLLDGKIDFEGQKLADRITRYLLISASIVSFLAGAVTQSLRTSFGVFAFATVALAIIVVPPWPFFNRHPVEWLPVPKKSKKT